MTFTRPTVDVAAIERVFTEWGLEFRPAEIIAGSVVVSTDDLPRVYYGLEWWERVQTLTYDMFKHGARFGYGYRRRWMGDDGWGEPVCVTERIPA